MAEASSALLIANDALRSRVLLARFRVQRLRNESRDEGDPQLEKLNN
jgi:hypothetical protein